MNLLGQADHNYDVQFNEADRALIFPETNTGNFSQRSRHPTSAPNFEETLEIEDGAAAKFENKHHQDLKHLWEEFRHIKRLE